MEQFLVRISPDIITVIILIFIMYLLHSDRMVGRRQAKVLSFVALLILFIVALEIITIYLEDYPNKNLVTLYKNSNALGFSLMSFIGILFAYIYLPRIKRYLIPISAPNIIFAILSFLSIWTGWIFSVDSNGYYHRGPFFILTILVTLYSLSVYAYALHVKKSSYDKVEQINLISQFSIVIFGGLIQVFYPKILMIWPCVALVLLLYIDCLKAFTYKYDSLTEVKNRICFDEDLEVARESEGLYIVIFDINNLKCINDVFGHVKGDEYIKSIARLIKKNISQIGVLYRIGGDEFCCLCEHVSKKHLEEVLKKLESEINVYVKTEETAIYSHEILAYGYAYYSKTIWESIEECFELADRSMYMRKNKQKRLQGQ